MKESFYALFALILKDKTIDDELMCIPTDDKQRSKYIALGANKALLVKILKILKITTKNCYKLQFRGQ